MMKNLLKTLFIYILTYMNVYGQSTLHVGLKNNIDTDRNSVESHIHVVDSISNYKDYVVAEGYCKMALDLAKKNIEIEEKTSKKKMFIYLLTISLIVTITLLLYQVYNNKVKFHRVNEKLNGNDEIMEESSIYDFKELNMKIHGSPKIAVTDLKGTHVIKTSSVLYCVSNGNYTTFIRENGKEIVVSKNLKYIESKLNPFGFLRIHRSYLINLDHIITFLKRGGGYVVMNNNKPLPITRSSKKILYEKLNVI